MAVVPTSDPVLIALRGASREEREKAALADIADAERHEFAAAAFREQAEWYVKEARRLRARAAGIAATADVAGDTRGRNSLARVGDREIGRDSRG